MLLLKCYAYREDVAEFDGTRPFNLSWQECNMIAKSRKLFIENIYFLW